MDVAHLAELLHETADRHHPDEQSAPPHDRWNWYAQLPPTGPPPG